MEGAYSYTVVVDCTELIGVCVRVYVSACLHVCVCLCYLGSYGRLLPTFAVTAADIAFWYQCNVGKCINKRCSTYMPTFTFILTPEKARWSSSTDSYCWCP